MPNISTNISHTCITIFMTVLTVSNILNTSAMDVTNENIHQAKRLFGVQQLSLDTRLLLEKNADRLDLWRLSSCKIPRFDQMYSSYTMHCFIKWTGFFSIKWVSFLKPTGFITWDVFAKWNVYSRGSCEMKCLRQRKLWNEMLETWCLGDQIIQTTKPYNEKYKSYNILFWVYRETANTMFGHLMRIELNQLTTATYNTIMFGYTTKGEARKLRIENFTLKKTHEHR